MKNKTTEKIEELRKQYVIIGKGRPWERKQEIVVPVGRSGRKKVAPLIVFIAGLSEFETTVGMFGHALLDEKYDDVYVPLALNMTSDEDQAWLEDNGTPMEIFEAFFEAAGILMGKTRDDPGVKDALGKSDGDEEKDQE